MRVFLSVIFVSILPGCCFIGCEEDVLLVPKAAVTVVDARSGEPVKAARVVVTRHPAEPHFMEPDRLEGAETDASGVARFEPEVGTVKQFPLMMHGVVGFAWQVCVEKKGYQTRAVRWFDQHRVPGADRDAVVKGEEELTLEIPLSVGPSSTCDEVALQRHPALEPDAITDALFCETDSDCATTLLNHDCCPLCWPDVVPANVAKAREQRCATASVDCPQRECKELTEETSVHCHHGMCFDYLPREAREARAPAPDAGRRSD